MDRLIAAGRWRELAEELEPLVKDQGTDLQTRNNAMAAYLLALGSLAQAGDEEAGRRLVEMDAERTLESLSVSEGYRQVFDQATSMVGEALSE